MPSALQRRRESSPTHTTDFATAIGIKRAGSAARQGPGGQPLRSEMGLADIVAGRSDATPGLYVCMECRQPLNLMEAWRVPASGQGMSNTSTLFCPPCAQKINQLGVLRIGPIQFDSFDQMNMGMRQQAFEDPSQKRALFEGVEMPVVENATQGKTATPEVAAATGGGINKWKNLLG